MTIAANPLRPRAGVPRPYLFPAIDRHRLANGLTLWLVPVEGATLASVHLLADAGAAAEDEAHGGVAALTAQLLVTGTKRLDAAAFAEASERLGIEMSSESSWDSSRAAFQALPEQLEPGLALLAEMLREPRFDPGEFERLRAERLADILQSRAEPGRLADESFIEHLYDAETPYHRPSAGLPETVKGLTVADVQAHHAAHYAPGLAHLIVAGAFDPDVVVRAAERELGSWSGSGPGHRTVAPRPAGGRRVVIVDRPGSVQSELRIGRIGIDRFDPQYFPAIVETTLLGGMFWARLPRRLREDLGYTYGIRCGFDPRRAAGPFSTFTAVQTEVTAPAIAETLALLEAAPQAPPDEDELDQARTYQVGVFPLRFETTIGIAAAIEPIAIYGLAEDFWQRYRSHIEAVDAAQAQQAAAALIEPAEMLVLAVGDASAIRADVDALGIGPVEVVPGP
jgi:predicted Zn-dependent peptidase